MSPLVMQRLNVVCASVRCPILVPPRSFCGGCSVLAGRRRVGGLDLDALSERQLERLYAGLLRLASLDATVLAALVEHVLAGDEPVSNS